MAQYRIDNRQRPIAFEDCGSMVARTIQNAKNLLMTRMGEVPFDRLRGFDPALYDLPMPKLREALLPELDRVMLWEPDAEIVEAECYLDEGGATVIEAIIEVNIDDIE